MCSARFRQSSKVMPSFSVRARTAVQTWSLMLASVFSTSLRKLEAAGHTPAGDCTSPHASSSMLHQLWNGGGMLWPHILPW